MKCSLTSLCLSSVSRIIYLSFQNSKSVVGDRGADQSSQTDGTENALCDTTLKGRWMVPVNGAFRSEGR